MRVCVCVVCLWGVQVVGLPLPYCIAWLQVGMGSNDTVCGLIDTVRSRQLAAAGCMAGCMAGFAWSIDAGWVPLTTAQCCLSGGRLS